jgi:aryl-alcohol dehydrogenase-like predicted oxidoreductase
MQVQYSLLDTRPENKMVEFCKANDITLLPFGTVAGGFMAERYLGVPSNQCADSELPGSHLVLFCQYRVKELSI